MSFEILAPFLKDEPGPRPRLTGIYFLIDRGDIVYVGQSTDIESRIALQWSMTRTSKPKMYMRFQRAMWMPVAENDLNDYEAAFIRALCPRYNIAIPRGNRDAEIAQMFGLSSPPPNKLKAFIRRREKSYGWLKRLRETNDVDRVTRATGKWLAYQLAGIES